MYNKYYETLEKRLNRLFLLVVRLINGPTLKRYFLIHTNQNVTNPIKITAGDPKSVIGQQKGSTFAGT